MSDSSWGFFGFYRSTPFASTIENWVWLAYFNVGVYVCFSGKIEEKCPLLLDLVSFRFATGVGGVTVADLERGGVRGLGNRTPSPPLALQIAIYVAVAGRKRTLVWGEL